MEENGENDVHDCNTNQNRFSSKCTVIHSSGEKGDKSCKPKWLEDFLSRTFFDVCATHHLYRNELSNYCVDCRLSICGHCASSDTHQEHKILKMYRHCYKDVVSLDSIENHMDCSEIQPYKCNTHMIICLKPLPHRGSVKNNEASTCNTCSRRLLEPDLYRYCSISCKVEAGLRKPNDSVPPSINTQSLNEGENLGPTEPLKRRNKRKGTPCRAPFF